MYITAVLTPKETISQTETTQQTAAASDSFSACLDEALSDDSLLSIFKQASETYGVSLSLLTAMAKQESNFQADATSGSGAMGIMQLMPSTAEYFGCSNPYDPKENIMTGARYISELLTRYNGNVSYALAAYNAGYNNVDKYGGIPPFEETQNYVSKITSYMNEGVTLPDGSNVAGTDTAQAASVQSGSALSLFDRLQSGNLNQLLYLLAEALEQTEDEDPNVQETTPAASTTENVAKKLDVAVISAPDTDIDSYYASRNIHYNNSVLNLMSQTGEN